VSGYPSNQELIDQFRRRQAAIQAVRFEALEKTIAKAMRVETETVCQPSPPLSHCRQWVNSAGRWLADHSWVVQQFQKHKGKNEGSIDPVIETVIDGEYEVIEVVEE
jgi:hypothetical protein